MSNLETKKTLKSIGSRKKELQDELKRLESELESDFDGIREEMSGRFDPSWWIRRYPLQSATAAMILGFIAGSKGGSKAGTIPAAIVGVIKGFATRKVIQTLVETFDKGKK